MSCPYPKVSSLRCQALRGMWGMLVWWSATHSDSKNERTPMSDPVYFLLRPCDIGTYPALVYDPTPNELRQAKIKIRVDTRPDFVELQQMTLAQIAERLEM